MAQIHTLDATFLALQAAVTPAWLQVVRAAAADEPEFADEEDEDEDDEDEEDEDNEDADKDDDEDEDDEDDEDDEEPDENDGDARARTTSGQLRRQNGHRWGGHTNG